MSTEMSESESQMWAGSGCEESQRAKPEGLGNNMSFIVRMRKLRPRDAKEFAHVSSN